MSADKSDLVERLRAAKPWVGKIGQDSADEIERLRTSLAEHEANARAYEEIIGKKTYQEVADELANANDVLGWVESWVSNPVGSYSVYALDGLFGMTRDKIAALKDISK